MNPEATYSEDDLLPLSGLQHLAFCPRQWALIHLEQQWQDNLLTIEGELLHERADDASFVEKRRGLIVARALPIASRYLGLSGKADVVEFEQTEEKQNSVRLRGRQQYWRPFPVEYKRGKPKTTDMDRIQLCAQAACLEEMLGVVVDHGAMFYWQVRQRELVQFTTQLRQLVKDLAQQMHQLFESGETPAPVQQPGCRNCSLRDRCLPTLGRTQRVEAYLKRTLQALEGDEVVHA